LLGSYLRLGGSSPNPLATLRSTDPKGVVTIVAPLPHPLRKGDIDGLRLITRPRQRHVWTDVSARPRFFIARPEGL